MIPKNTFLLLIIKCSSIVHTPRMKVKINAVFAVNNKALTSQMKLSARSYAMAEKRNLSSV